jgi:hypothetical protein
LARPPPRDVSCSQGHTSKVPAVIALTLKNRIDAWIADGVLGGEQLNAADFMVAPSLALILYRPDVLPLFEGRPALELVDRRRGRRGGPSTRAWRQACRRLAARYEATACPGFNSSRARDSLRLDAFAVGAGAGGRLPHATYLEEPPLGR